MKEPKLPKRTIRENAWGNWYGYEGGRRVIDFSNTAFGGQEEYAQEWVERRENDPDSLHSMHFDTSMLHTLAQKDGPHV